MLLTGARMPVVAGHKRPACLWGLSHTALLNGCGATWTAAVITWRASLPEAGGCQVGGMAVLGQLGGFVYTAVRLCKDSAATEQGKRVRSQRPIQDASQPSPGPALTHTHTHACDACQLPRALPPRAAKTGTGPRDCCAGLL